MPGRKMLHDVMSMNDIYAFAEPIVEMLREDYGSYDAEILDEVLVEEAFAQRLGARGYEVRPWAEAATPTPPPPAPARPNPGSANVVPVTVVRPRRTTGGARSGPGTGGGERQPGRPAAPPRGPEEQPSGSERRAESPGRGRRAATSGAGTRSEAGNGTSAGTGTRRRTKSDSTSGDEAAAPRPTRRTTRTPRTEESDES